MRQLLCSILAAGLKRATITSSIWACHIRPRAEETKMRRRFIISFAGFASEARFALYSLYSGRCLPAWRNSQTGTFRESWPHERTQTEREASKTKANARCLSMSEFLSVCHSLATALPLPKSCYVLLPLTNLLCLPMSHRYGPKHVT